MIGVLAARNNLKVKNARQPAVRKGVAIMVQPGFDGFYWTK